MSLACSEIAWLSPALRVSHLEEYSALFSIFSVIRQFLCTRWLTPRTPTPLRPFFHLPAACGILGSDFSWWVTVSPCSPAPAVPGALGSKGPGPHQGNAICDSQPRNARAPLGCPGWLCGFPLNSSQHVILRTSFLLGWCLWAGGGGGAPGSLLHEDRYTEQGRRSLWLSGLETGS